MIQQDETRRKVLQEVPDEKESTANSTQLAVNKNCEELFALQAESKWEKIG